MAKAIKFKNWCTQNISPQAWSRIVLKSIVEIRAAELNLDEVDNPNPNLELNESIMNALNQSLDDLYQLKIEAEVL